MIFSPFTSNMIGSTFLLFTCFCLASSSSVEKSTQTGCDFPPGFKFGAATSAYQIEGSWNASEKTASIWDNAIHTKPYLIKDGSNADIACDSYNQIDVDIANLKLLNVSFYRFSISWPRLLPNGGDNFINPDGVRYYNELISKLVANNIEPMVTLYHGELPQSLQDLGGWTNHLMVEYYTQFARVCFKLFGDRVKTWLTFNQPRENCVFPYETQFQAPFVASKGVGTYLCVHTILLSHAKAYHIYKDEFPDLKGEIGITAFGSWFYPATNSTDDKMAAERARAMEIDWIAHPIFSKTGDYPPFLRERIDSYSKQQGYRRSRLPYFTPEEVVLLRGSSDFYALNHYMSFIATLAPEQNASKTPSFENDSGVTLTISPEWQATARDVFKVTPDSLRFVLNYIKNTYGNPKIYITENGYAGHQNESTQDKERVAYLNLYLTAVLKAIHQDKCDVRRYTAWSLMDNFEWADGYTLRFGMFHVDFNDPKRTRTPKDSVLAYRNIIKTGSIPRCSASTDNVIKPSGENHPGYLHNFFQFIFG